MNRDYFLDTCVFMHSVDQNEKYFAKAYKIITNYSFATTNLVKQELESINSLRNKIYSIITGDRIFKFKNLKEIGEYVLGVCVPRDRLSKNIINYVRMYIIQIADYLKINAETVLTPEKRNNVKEAAFFVARFSRNELNILVNNFSKPEYKKMHLIFIDYTDNTYQNFQKDLMEKINPKKEELNDSKIIANAIYYAYSNYQLYLFVSSDMFFIRNKDRFMRFICQKYHAHEVDLFPQTSRVLIKQLSEI